MSVRSGLCVIVFSETALLLNDFSEKVAKFEMKFPKFSPRFAPKFAPKFSPNIFVLAWQVEKFSPQISPDFSHWRFQISNRIPNQVSPRISQTYFRRLGSPDVFSSRLPCTCLYPLFASPRLKSAQSLRKYLVATNNNHRLWGSQPITILRKLAILCLNLSSRHCRELSHKC